MKLFDIGILECTEASRKSPMAEIIKRHTGTWLTHAVVFQNRVGDIWDATIGGIQFHNIYEEYPGRKITVLRYDGEIDEGRVLAWMDHTVDTSEGYDYLALIDLLTGRVRFQQDNKWYCSELASKFLSKNGYPIFRTEKDLCYPADLYYSRSFVFVEEFVIPGEPKEDYPDMSGIVSIPGPC